MGLGRCRGVRQQPCCKAARRWGLPPGAKPASCRRCVGGIWRAAQQCRVRLLFHICAMPTAAPLLASASYTLFCAFQVEEGAAVAIYAEGKEHAMAIGYTKMSTQQVGRWAKCRPPSSICPRLCLSLPSAVPAKD